MKTEKSTYILAEMASSHEGDPKIAEFIIKGAAEAGADGILLQLIDLDTYIVPLDEDYEDIKSFYMKQENWVDLIKKANSLNLDVWANVYDLKSFKFCTDKKIKGFKLHSSNLENKDLVKQLVSSGKEVLLSIGGMDKKEIEKILDLIYSINKKAEICLMYGLQNFPTRPEGINLNFIKDLSDRLNLAWGYQDHSKPTSSASTYLPILAVNKGATVIEKHITHNRDLKGQDYEAALNPDEFIKFVKDIRIADNLLQKKTDEVSADELKYRDYKSIMKLVAKRDIKIGEKFSRENLTVMRAKQGEISGKRFESLIDKKSERAYKKFESIKKDEFFKTGIFITARLKSTRLPKKVIKPILGKPMIEWMIDRLKKCNIEPIVMMTSTNPQDDPLIEIAKKNNIEYFRGSEQDVLVRMRDCAQKFNIDLVISVTADDPFKEPIFINKMVERYLETKFDFCEIKGLPNGCESYAVSKDALNKVCGIKDDFDTEIWGPYFKEPGIFKCEIIKVSDPKIFRPQYRATVDEKEDFELATKIFEILLKEKEYFNVYDICKLLDENKDLNKINAHIQQIQPEKSPKIKIYLCDFFHNYLGAATAMFPLNIGYLAAWIKKFFPQDVDIELFKYPDDFLKRIKQNKPDLVGFSNYVWSADLNNRISKKIKDIYPETIIVFGGPDISYSEKGFKKFFDNHTCADFYLLYQGEVPFLNLIKKILDKGQDLSMLKSEPIDGIVFYDKNKNSIVKGNDLSRIKDVDSIPSPYLTGVLDKFFETNLIPIVETNRGCPYTCTYCCQGFSSHNRIEFFNLKRVKQELRYIANKIKNTNLLIFADSNFGIVERDIEIAKYIARLVEETGYPRKLNVNWAKNQPKIFEIAEILKNINLIISLQSLDETVLKNIKRQNIQISVFKDIIEKVNEKKGMSGTEIILGMPGETKESHLETIRKLFDWNVSYIICYNCLILDGSELALQKENGEFKCQIKYRLMDNAFGKYDSIMSFETEQGIRSTGTISEQEILYFRPVHWLIQFLWNYRFYHDLLKYFQTLGINPLDYIVKLIDDVEVKACLKVKNIFQDFKQEAEAEWFDSSEALYNYYSQPEKFDWLRKGNYGKMNGKYIFKVLIEAKEEFEDYLYNTAISMVEGKDKIISDILKFHSESIVDFRKNWEDIAKEKKEFNLYLPQSQQESLQALLRQYQHQNKNVTLRKMSEYMDIRDLFYKLKNTIK